MEKVTGIGGQFFVPTIRSVSLLGIVIIWESPPYLPTMSCLAGGRKLDRRRSFLSGNHGLLWELEADLDGQLSRSES